MIQPNILISILVLVDCSIYFQFVSPAKTIIGE